MHIHQRLLPPSHNDIVNTFPRKAYVPNPIDYIYLGGEDCHNWVPYIEKEAQSLYATYVGGGQGGNGFAEVDFICKIIQMWFGFPENNKEAFKF